MRRAIPVLIALIGLLVYPAQAQPAPEVISFQGRLTGPNGQPVPDDSYQLQFRLYDQPRDGTLQWTETQVVTTRDGVFAALLGSVSPLSGLSFEEGYYLALTVNGSSELGPRTALAAVPHAFIAQRLDEAALEAGSNVTITRQGDGALRIEAAGGGTGGLTRVTTDATLEGEGTAGSPLGLADGAVVAGQNVNVTRENDGSFVVSATGGGGGLNRVEHDSTLLGDGTGSAPLGLADGSVTGVKLSDTALRAGTNVTITRQGDGALEITSTEAGFSLPYAGSVSSSDAAMSIENTGSGGGISVSSPGSTGLLVRNAGGHGLRIQDATSNGIQIDQAGIDGIQIQSAGRDGLFVSAANDGVRIGSARRYGLNVVNAVRGVDINTTSSDGVIVRNAGQHGLLIVDANTNGLQIDQAGVDGIQIQSAGRDGLFVPSAGRYGLNVANAVRGVDISTTTSDGVIVRNAGQHGLLIVDANTNGLQINQAGVDGIQIQSAGNDGVRIGSAGRYGLNVINAVRGVDINTTSSDGVIVRNAGQNGLLIVDANTNGLQINQAGVDGIQIQSAGVDGIQIQSAGNDGVLIGSAGRFGLNVVNAVRGVDINTTSSDGVIVRNAGGHGLRIQDATSNGIQIDQAGGNGLQVDQAGVDGIQIQSAGRDGIRVGSVGALAGNFGGDVEVIGTLSKSGGSFKIDHPLDPANQYLSHSFVESPDMMNVYNGNAVLDAAGEAVIDLPNYFDVLNRDFRYQLTAIGTPGPNLYIAERISGNRFRIAGGEPGMEVSWQVTGIRQDAWAEQNRIVVEEAKPAEERGYYLHPEAFGRSRQEGIFFRDNTPQKQ